MLWPQGVSYSSVRRRGFALLPRSLGPSKDLSFRSGLDSRQRVSQIVNKGRFALFVVFAAFPQSLVNSPLCLHFGPWHVGITAVGLGACKAAVLLWLQRFGDVLLWA